MRKILFAASAAVFICVFSTQVSAQQPGYGTTYAPQAASAAGGLQQRAAVPPPVQQVAVAGWTIANYKGVVQIGEYEWAQKFYITAISPEGIPQGTMQAQQSGQLNDYGDYSPSPFTKARPSTENDGFVEIRWINKNRHRIRQSAHGLEVTFYQVDQEKWSPVTLFRRF